MNNIEKQKIIFKLNTIILSALDKSSVLWRELTSENDKMLDFVDEDLSKSYKKALMGENIPAEPVKAPNLAAAVFYLNDKKYPYAFFEFAKLLKCNPNNIELKKSTALCLLKMKAYNVLLNKFVPFFLKHIDEDDEIQSLVAGTYFGISEFYKDAIPLYEKLVKKDKNDKYGYNYRLAYLYERVYQDKKLKIQINYAEKALEHTDKTNIVNAFLGKLYYRAGKKDKCQKCFDKIMANNPSCDELVSYGRFLMKNGKIKEGYDMYRARFDTGRITYPKLLLSEKRWDGKKDISNATVIVHYEQGFGDSIMFSRYIPRLASMARKIIFVVQKNLIPVFKSSGFERYCTLLSHEADVNPNITLDCINRSVMYSAGEGMGKIAHDYHIPMMDLPYLMDESPDKMREAAGYLTADKDKTEEFRKKYIEDNLRLKIGLAFHGTKQSIVTYRDIPIKKFLPLFEIEGIDFYSFQADEYAKELEDLSDNIKIYDLGKKFNNFEDTACALSCMDLTISTDNAVMNLAGAMGLKTYCLFNVYSESRWYKTEGDDIGWYRSVKPFRAKTFNDWENLISEVKKSILKDFPKLAKQK